MNEFIGYWCAPGQGQKEAFLWHGPDPRSEAILTWPIQVFLRREAVRGRSPRNIAEDLLGAVIMIQEGANGRESEFSLSGFEREIPREQAWRAIEELAIAISNGTKPVWVDGV